MSTAVGSASDVTAPRTMTRMRWAVIWLAFVGLSINYLDRSSLSVALPFMGEDFHLTGTQQGLIFAAFFWAYDVCQLAAGWYVDKVGPRRSFTIAALWWSVCTMATSLARGFGSLFAVRFLLGVGESPAPSTSAKVVATWFPKSERAFATSIWDSGSRVGAVIALPIVTLVISITTWHGVFIIIGALGVVWAFAWWKIYRSPQEHPRVDAAELAYIEDGGARTAGNDDAAAAKLPWRSLFRYRTILSMMFGFFCLNSAIYFFITFFPSYLVSERGFDLLKLGMFGALPGVCAVACGWLGGLAADRAVRRGHSITRVRKTQIAGGLTGGSVIMFAAVVPEAWMALALLSLAYSSLTIAATGIWSLPADVAPSSNHVGSIGGIQNFASNLAGIFTPVVIGVLVDRTGSYIAPLAVIGAVALLGAANYLFIMGKVEPLKVEDTITSRH
ncbi:MFS transporter [Rhodococcus opacus]|uniref:MFS transporter n=1 Tax=Rhodococcus opacus TaxID=37919 RepID=UPI0015F89EC7|nr:MFS transporter [Rhodococcus opacus]MBA8961773.1 ACS family glucarate transporter-like MFS transporter [Rhodococcus opacus]MBP2202363.1 ACS family glucarate transporter-like MFS transporter [Rhodococcus opacus]MDJ0415945.1 MFS transporter [Rhodococcus opacus]UNM99237.1 MFS transporter [Rhodococcus opacus]UZG54885.1 MFS transporter [Rhodococcus opacus]